MSSWRDARPDGHDELVAVCLGSIDKIVEQCGGEPSLGKQMHRSETVEKPCGGGFIDLCVVWEGGVWFDGSMHFKVFPAIIVEVKSQRETWNAGDVIRQLKRYKKDLRLHWPSQPTIEEAEALEDEYGHRMALFAGRRCTDTERKLLEHEGVTILDL